MITDKIYRRWLKSAYEYYLGEGFEETMGDHEWDYIAREIAKNPEQYPELAGKNYKGGSLFFLRAKDYPNWVTDKYEI